MSGSKQCAKCYQYKPNQNFRYIKYLGKYRRYCNNCESKINLKKATERSRFIHDNGISISKHLKITQQAKEMAQVEAQQSYFQTIPNQKRKRYELAKRISILAPKACLLFIVISALFSLQDSSVLVISLLLFIFIYVAYDFFILNEIKPVETTINNFRIGYFNKHYLKLKKDSFIYDEFYRSSEWRQLRKIFITKQKKLLGKHVCYYCNKTIFSDVTVDHFLPRSKFPEMALKLDNLRISCRPCNSSKGANLIQPGLKHQNTIISLNLKYT